MVTGGVNAENMASYLQAGAVGAGMGSALYKAAKPAEAVLADGRKFAEIYSAARASLA